MASLTRKGIQMAKVFIATPMYGGMATGHYTQSIMMLQLVFAQRGHQTVTSFMYNESLIPRARNALAKAFLKTDCTHLLFIDADIHFNPHEVAEMITADKEIICGIYPKKEINWYTVEAAVKNGVPTNELRHHTGSWVVNLVNYDGTVTVPANQPIEIWNGGTGMMLIKRDVLEILSRVVPFYKNDVGDVSGNMQDREVIYCFFDTSIEGEHDRYLSEDYHFCMVARQNGYKVWAAPWVKLGHFGTYLFEGRFLEEKNEPQESTQAPVGDNSGPASGGGEG